jgi:hypothetical protein
LEPWITQLDQRCRDLLWIIPLDEMKVGTRVCSAHVRHLATTNPVRRGDDVGCPQPA